MRFTLGCRPCTHRPRGFVGASMLTGERYDDIHTMKIRLGLISPGDRRTRVGRALRVRRQRGQPTRHQRAARLHRARPSRVLRRRRRRTRRPPRRRGDAGLLHGRGPTAATTGRRPQAAQDRHEEPQLNAAGPSSDTSMIGSSGKSVRRQQRLEGPVGQPRQLRPGGRQGADGRHRRLLGRQQGRRRSTRAASRSSPPIARTPGGRATPSRTTSTPPIRPAAGGWRPARTSSRRHARPPDSRPPTSLAPSASPSSPTRRRTPTRVSADGPGDRRVPVWVQVPGTPGTPGSPATTGRRTPGLAPPATGTGRARALRTAARAGPVLLARRLLVERYHCYIRPSTPAAGG